MKKLLILLAVSCAILVSCGQKNQTSEQKVAEQTSKVYALNANERNLAASNAKSVFNLEFINASNAKGQFLSCNPSDSNYNGLVTCNGLLPLPNGTYAEAVRYCGYKPDLVGCSKTDTVK